MKNLMEPLMIKEMIESLEEIKKEYGDLKFVKFVPEAPGYITRIVPVVSGDTKFVFFDWYI